MAQTAIEICNHALDLIGANTITSLTDPVREAQVSNRTLPIARRAFLRDNLYNFAQKFEVLTAEDPLPTPNPLPDFNYVFDLSGLSEDWLKIWAVKRNANKTTRGLPYMDRWKRAGDFIGAEVDEVVVQYGFDPQTVASNPDSEDYAAWDSASYDALCALMAYKMSITLTQSESLQDRMLRESQQAQRMAQNVDGVEGIKDRYRTDNRLIGVRDSSASWSR
jgi:hypothetical protein